MAQSQNSFTTHQSGVAPAGTRAGGATATDVGLLLIRAIVGIVFIYHGYHKLFGGLRGFADALDAMGLPLPMVSAALAACAEFFGGLALLLGVATRIAVVPMVFTMIVAILTAHRHAFSLQHGGMEYALTLGVVMLGLGLTGAGRLSVDGAMKSRRAARPAGL